MEGSYAHATYDLHATYTSVGGTAVGGGRVVDAPEAPAELIAWLRSDEASAYQGLWVLLEEWRPVDSDLSPSALLERHPSAEREAIVFVQSRDVEIGV